jgi:multiple sugar transport system permease protein
VSTRTSPATEPTIADPAESAASRTPIGQSRTTRAAWLFIAPFAVFYLLFMIWPVIYMLITSFFDTTLIRPGFGNFIGFDNYVEMLTKAEFWEAMWHTVLFTLYTVPPLVILAFVLAVLANRVRRGQWLFRLAFFVPFILPSAAIALIWYFIFTPTTGLWNSFQSLLGAADPSPVLGTPDLAMIGIAVTTVWWTIGFNFVLYLAGLQDIPRELYEAAAVDGASPWQQIRFITVPLLSRVTTLVILLQIIASLKIFDQVYLLTAGGPGTSTRVLLMLVTDTAFTDFRVGAGSAASVLLFVLILLVTLIRQLVSRRQSRRES